MVAMVKPDEEAQTGGTADADVITDPKTFLLNTHPPLSKAAIMATECVFSFPEDI